MSGEPAESVEGSSIKPVSSLRSHFEKLQGPGTPSQGAATLPRLSTHLERPLTQSARLDGRISLDIPRNNGVNGNLTYLAATTKPNIPLTPVARLRPTPASASKPRPTSMGPLSPPRSPPRVTIESPSSPPKPIEQTQGSMPFNVSNGSTPHLKKSSGQSSRSGSPTNNGRQFKIPSRVNTPVFEARQVPYIQSATLPGPSRDPHKRIFDGVAKPSPIPPPINRAGKPKIIGNRLITDSSPERSVPGTLSAIERPTTRHSPFSTPPSSDDSPHHSPPYINQSTKPNAGARQPAPARDSYFPHQQPRPSADLSRIGNSHATRPAQPHTTPSQPLSARPQHQSDLPEDRPGLPPRRDIPQNESRPASKSIRPTPPEPPPPRRSIDPGTRPTIPAIDEHVRDASAQFAPPPKRAFAPPPTSIVQSFPREPPRASLDAPRNQVFVNRDFDSDEAEESGNQPATVLTDFPDSSQANRRPPFFRNGPREIPTKYDTKVFGVCGEFVCTTGYVTRVWDVLTGALLVSLSHGDTVKVTAMAFRPAADVQEEGKRIWLGTNIGGIQEIDVPTNSLAVSKDHAHTKSAVIKMYRCGSEMWTLDDEGRLYVWPADESGSPSLSQMPHSFRVPKGHTFSMVVESNLWHATGKDIRVFQRDIANHSFNPILQRPLNQLNVGEVTSGAIIPSQPDRIYFGHIDGKVTIYSRKDYSCFGVVSVSSYKISSLVGVGDYLWAGYNTGMMYVYDTRCTPWKVQKDWIAHEKPIAGIVVDRTSIWKMDRLQVVSLGTDNMLRLWDGILREDWLELEMQGRDAEYCEFDEVSAMVLTWNAGASKPTSLRHHGDDAYFFQNLFRSQSPPDILVFGFQELVDLEDKKLTAKTFFKSKSKKVDAYDQEHMSHQYRAWRDHFIRCLDEHMPSDEPYDLLHTANLVGLFTCIFVKSSVRSRVKNINAAEVKLGMGGLHGNKGALIVRFVVDDSSLCFINCHLAAGQSNTTHRNNDIAEILEREALPAQRDSSIRSDMFVGGGDGSMIMDHEICILNGDLNYRIDTMSRDTVIKTVKAGNIEKLLERDQLLLSRKRNPGFRLRAFRENTITFAPTYKYDVGTDRYDTSEKKRAPAWCDRLLYRGIGRVKQVDYRRHEVHTSDHRPVSGLFRIRVKTIEHKRKAKVKESVERRFEEVKQRIAMDVKMDYLVNVFGLSTKEARKLLTQ